MTNLGIAGLAGLGLAGLAGIAGVAGLAGTKKRRRRKVSCKSKGKKSGVPNTYTRGKGKGSKRYKLKAVGTKTVLKKIKKDLPKGTSATIPPKKYDEGYALFTRKAKTAKKRKKK